MKIRRPDADKARKQLERQHMAAATRAAAVVRTRRAPAGMPSVEALAALGRAHQESQARMLRGLRGLASALNPQLAPVNNAAIVAASVRSWTEGS